MKITKKKRWCAGLLAAITAASFTACQKDGGSGNTANINLDSYPIDTDVTLTYWHELGVNALASVVNYGETPFAEEMEKRTGVKVEYIHPAQGQATEAFSLMVASNDLPDMIYNRWIEVLGSPSTAIDDGVILSLNKLMDKHAPALKQYLNENPDRDKLVKTDAGDYYSFPFFRPADSNISAGPIMRKDWLDDLGLAEPRTVSELENVLRQFKEKKGATAPFTILGNGSNVMFEFLGARNTFYLDNGQVKYGPLEPEYKEAVTTYNRWFKEGLLDRNYASVDSKTQDANMLNGKSGLTYGSGRSGLSRWNTAMEGKDEKFDLMGLRYFADEETGEPRFITSEGCYSGWGTAITTSCKNPELAAKFLDYAYTEEGYMLSNYGIEGVSYEIVDGEPVFTELITDNPDELSMSQAMALYTKNSDSGSFVGAEINSYVNDRHREACENWAADLPKVKSRDLPLVTYTSEESDEYSRIMTEVEKTRSEMVATFISGVNSLDNYDAFINEMKELKIDRAIEIVQGAVDRYNKR